MSISRNAVTFDEFQHLPAGISYYDHGTFWCYHHNPPLVKLLFAFPAVVAGVPTDYSSYYYVPGARGADFDLGRDFMMVNHDRYMEVFVVARAVVAVLSVLGGYFVFRWSRELFGDAGGLLSLGLWTLCPNILAHGGLVTPDLGATVFGFIATYAFWHYLRAPSGGRAFVCGVLMGLAQAAKFSSVALPFLWAVMAVVKIWQDRSPAAEDCARLGWRQACGHALVVTLVSLAVLNDVYLLEGTGKAAGSFEFKSRTLTKETPDGGRENRFRGTVLENLPLPLPAHYVLGFDHQMYDADSRRAVNYLRGETRRGEGWWYYYLYGLLVKTPLGTLALVLCAAVALLAARRCRTDLVSELALLLPIVVLLVLVSSQTGLNRHLRYVLPIFPFVFVFAGRLGPLVVSRRLWQTLLALALATNAWSVLKVHPFYLAYFNEAAGGPERGRDHLANSNIDWGQGLLALRDWLDENAPGRKIHLAYFGTMEPRIVGIDYELPPFAPSEADRRQPYDPKGVGPAPGLQAVSTNCLLNIPFRALNGLGDRTYVGRNSLTYYRHFEPVAVLGFSIFVYDLSVADVNRVRQELGLLPWPEEEGGKLP